MAGPHRSAPDHRDRRQPVVGKPGPSAEHARPRHASPPVPRPGPPIGLPDGFNAGQDEGQYHWSAVLGDFTDDFYDLCCPHCAIEVTVAIGNYGRYSAIRDWQAGDRERRDLKPTSPGALVGTGRWMYDTAVRDGHDWLANGLTYLSGRADCPRCASTFVIAVEYTAANLPFPGA